MGYLEDQDQVYCFLSFSFKMKYELINQVHVFLQLFLWENSQNMQKLVFRTNKM